MRLFVGKEPNFPRLMVLGEGLVRPRGNWGRLDVG